MRGGNDKQKHFSGLKKVKSHVMYCSAADKANKHAYAVIDQMLYNNRTSVINNNVENRDTN